MVEKEIRIVEPLQLHPLFGLNQPEQVILGASLVLEEVTSMLCLLRKFEDIFTWSHVDMLGVWPTVVGQFNRD